MLFICSPVLGSKVSQRSAVRENQREWERCRPEQKGCTKTFAVSYSVNIENGVDVVDLAAETNRGEPSVSSTTQKSKRDTALGC